MPSNVKRVHSDFTAENFWLEVVQPAHRKFQNEQTIANALMAAMAAWHLHEWVWRARYSHQKKRSEFAKDIIKACHDLLWVRDFANASKHSGIDRPATPPVEVKRVAGKRIEGEMFTPLGMQPRVSHAPPITIELDNDQVHDFTKTLQTVIDWWVMEHFPPPTF